MKCFKSSTTYKSLGTSEEIPRCRWEDNIKMYLRETG
jgi:hypothetical protein